MTQHEGSGVYSQSQSHSHAQSQNFEESAREVEQIRHVNETINQDDSYRAQTEASNIQIVTPHYKSGERPGSEVRTGASAVELNARFAEAHGDYKAERSQEHFRMQIIDPKVDDHAHLPAHAPRDYARKKLIEDFPSLHSKRSFLDLDALEQRSVRKPKPISISKYLTDSVDRHPKADDFRDLDKLKQSLDALQKCEIRVVPTRGGVSSVPGALSPKTNLSSNPSSCLWQSHPIARMENDDCIDLSKIPLAPPLKPAVNIETRHEKQSTTATETSTVQRPSVQKDNNSTVLANVSYPISVMHCHDVGATSGRSQTVANQLKQPTNRVTEYSYNRKVGSESSEIQAQSINHNKHKPVSDDNNAGKTPELHIETTDQEAKPDDPDISEADRRVVYWPPLDSERPRPPSPPQPRSIFDATTRANFEHQKARELVAMRQRESEASKWREKQEMAHRRQAEKLAADRISVKPPSEPIPAQPIDGRPRSWRYVYAVGDEPTVEARNEILASGELLRRDLPEGGVDILERREAFIERSPSPLHINYVGRRWQPPTVSHSSPATASNFEEYSWLPVVDDPPYQMEHKNFTPPPSPPVDASASPRYGLGAGTLDAAGRRQLRGVVAPQADGDHRPPVLFQAIRKAPAGGFYPHAPNVVKAAAQPKSFPVAANGNGNAELDELARIGRQIEERSKSRRFEYRVEPVEIKTEVSHSPFTGYSNRLSFGSRNKSLNGSTTNGYDHPEDLLSNGFGTRNDHTQRYSYASTMRSLLREEPPPAPPVVRTVVRHEPPVRHEVVEVRREVKPKVTQNVQRFEERKRTEEVERRVIRRERRHKSSRVRYGHHHGGQSQDQWHTNNWSGGRGLRSSSAASRNGYGGGGGGDYYYHSSSRHGGGGDSDRYYHRGAEQARYGGGSVSDSLRRGDLKYGPNGDVRENGHGHHNGNSSEKYSSTRRVHKSYSTRDIYGGGGASSHGYGVHQPVVEFPPTLPRHGASQYGSSSGAPAPPPHRQTNHTEYYYHGGGHGASAKSGRLTKSRSYADWGDGGRGPFGSSIRRYDDDMARLENEFRDSLLMKLPTAGGNMNEKDYRHEQIPGGYETYEREVKASSGRKVHPDGVPTDFKESSQGFNFKRETQR